MDVHLAAEGSRASASACVCSTTLTSPAAMPLSMADVERRLAALEEGQKKTTALALATDRDLQRERARHQVIVHFRGALLAAVTGAFAAHKEKKEAQR
eukprot:6432787-Pyramimonas_sp.AAC.1